MADFYGSTTVDAALTTACDLASTSGGSETTVNTAYGVGAAHYGEAYSQGSINGTVWTSIPDPTGNGWVFAPGIGFFPAGNYSAAIAFTDPTGPSDVADITLRFYKYSGGGYTLIGSIVVNTVTINTTRTNVSFPATAMARAGFADGEYLYVDIWYHTVSTNIGGIQPSVYVSTSSLAGVASDLQVTIPTFVYDTSDPYTIIMYGAKVNDGTLTTASDMATQPGGTEVLSATTGPFTGTSQFGEVFSQGGAPASVAAIPATPTGHGWVYQPGAGSFAAGNWSAVFRVEEPTAGNYTVTPTVRFFKYSAGAYTSIGQITGSATAFTGTTPVTWTFTGAPMVAMTFGANDFIYTDLWLSDAGGSAGGDNVAVELGTSVSAGVANDAQVTTAVFTPLAAAPQPTGHRPRWVMRAITGGIFTPFQAMPAWVERALTAPFVKQTQPVNIPHYVRRSITNLLLNYGLNITTRFRLAIVFDIVTRFRLAKLNDIATRFRLQANGTQSVRDIASRFRLMQQSIRDVASRFRLKSADQLKDIASRFRLAQQSIRDVATRFRLMQQSIRDINTRFRLGKLNDIATRFRLAKLNDIKTRFRLMQQSVRDISTRFRLGLLKDITTRFRLGLVKDITTRFILAVANQQVKDIASRFRLMSANQLKDITTRFRLAKLKDISSRFRLMSANQLKDVVTRFVLVQQRLKDVTSRFRLKSADQLKDVASRFRLMSANQLKDVKTRLRLKSADQLRDIAARFILMSIGTLRARDISCRFILIAPSDVVWVSRDGKAIWITRDDVIVWDARDDLTTWKAR